VELLVAANTGGGGGGDGTNMSVATNAGGSGIVIVKYSIAKASGGTITTDGTYWYHTFTTSGTFVPYENLTADCLVIAGGGAGAATDGNDTQGGGGGGAGGLRSTVTATGGWRND
jgi:hypothetical protein